MPLPEPMTTAITPATLTTVTITIEASARPWPSATTPTATHMGAVYNST